jgi:hypothetical protein
MAATLFRLLLLLGEVVAVICVAGTLSETPDRRRPLFDWETKQLTPDYLVALKKNEVFWQHASLFDSAKGIDLRLPPSGFCKVFPGDASWPSSELWGALDVALGNGTLISNTPIGAVCYESARAYDRNKCDALLKVFSRPGTQYATDIF